MINANNNAANSPSLLPDLTPLLDIIFIVMVFLLLTASVKLESVDVTLPSAEISEPADVQNKSMTINILNQEPYWALEGKNYIDWENFTLAVLEQHQADSERPIVIGADKTADVEHLVKVLSFLQENSIEATQLLTEQ
ncbi:ExbD/TolR family protein [Vibrio maerlii]|uniref:ExbD/TolR family protein n=1 Tax=Vibrio maerlii TaxID=2231648 RepID=UPI000E3E8E45|nr:biopolymer transporter ExbD [Vibrio maerlii]